jgi:Holliday junction resolvasome RuvABC endonuclease subunit
VRVRPVVAGLDLSLTCPACVVIPDGWKLGDWRNLERTRAIVPSVQDRDPDRSKAIRLIKIVGRLREFVLENRATHCFVEGYAFSRHSSSVTKLAELGGYARVEFFSYGRVLREVTVSQARKLLLGKLPPRDAKKVVEAQLKRHGAEFADDNECDAFAIANWGLSELGLPFVCLA